MTELIRSQAKHVETLAANTAKAVQRCGGSPRSSDSEEDTAEPRAAPSVQRQGDTTKMSISADWAAGLSDAMLDAKARRLKEQIQSLAPGDIYRIGAEDNLSVLRREQMKRLQTALPGVQLGPTVPRPAGLPIDGAFRLEEAQGLPSALMAALPEGEIVEVEMGAREPEVVAATPAAEPSSVSPAQVTEPLGMGAYSGVSAGDLLLRQCGFSAAGEDAIGIVAIPSVSLKRLTPPTRRP